MNVSEIAENEKPIIFKSRADIQVTKWLATMPSPANLSVGPIHYAVRSADGDILWAGGTPAVIVVNEDGAFAIFPMGHIFISKRFSQILPTDGDAALNSKLENWLTVAAASEGLRVDWRLHCPNLYREINGDRSVAASLEIQDVNATAHEFDFKLKAEGTATRIGVSVATNPLSTVSCQEILPPQ